MNKGSVENGVIFYDLKWDTEYFGIKSAKAILNKPLTCNEWKELKAKFKDYQFISIENRNSEPINAQMIGKDTSAFLADVNIQFEKKLIEPYEMSQNITIHQELEKMIELLKWRIFNFQSSQRTLN